jgi:hypothetical protein
MSPKKKLKHKIVRKVKKNLGYPIPDWKAFKKTWASPERVSW